MRLEIQNRLHNVHCILALLIDYRNNWQHRVYFFELDYSTFSYNLVNYSYITGNKYVLSNRKQKLESYFHFCCIRGKDHKLNYVIQIYIYNRYISLQCPLSDHFPTWKRSKKKNFSSPLLFFPSIQSVTNFAKSTIPTVRAYAPQQDPFHVFPQAHSKHHASNTWSNGSRGFSISVLRRKRSKKSKCVGTIQEPGATVKRTVRWPAFRTRHPCFVTSTRERRRLGASQPVLS